MGIEAYNKFPKIDEFSYNCISHLMNDNDLFWKLLYYNDPDAWKQPNLTVAQKSNLIYSGQEDESQYRVFMDVGQPDVWTDESCIVRISPYSLFPDNRTIGTVTMAFEVYCHFKINHLSCYKTRVDIITKQFIEIFNGFEIGGLGRLFFDRFGSLDNRGLQSGQLPFKGKWILMSTKVG